MKVLLDACVWEGALRELRSAGHDVVWAGDWPPGLTDLDILARARVENRILVTLDKDFGELAVAGGASHCGIIRLVNISARRQAEVCLHVLQRYTAEIALGPIITAEPGRIRIRHVESDGEGTGGRVSS